MSRKASQVDQIVKLIVGAGQASPSPPVGPALGSKGVKSMDFCKASIPSTVSHSSSDTFQFQEFNARTADYLPGIPIPARVTVRPDRSFHFELRTPPTASLLLTAANAAARKNRVRGAGNTAGPHRINAPGGDVLGGKASVTSAAAANGNAGVPSVGTVSLKHVYEIARIKQSEPRLSGVSLESLCKSVIAQAGSMGVVVVP